jgi:hypothetical protein
MRVFGKQTRHQAFVIGIDVMDQYEGHSAVARHCFEKTRKGMHPTSRRTQTDNGECLRLASGFSVRIRDHVLQTYLSGGTGRLAFSALNARPEIRWGWLSIEQHNANFVFKSKDTKAISEQLVKHAGAILIWPQRHGTGKVQAFQPSPGLEAAALSVDWCDGLRFSLNLPGGPAP